ncbi:CpaF family protein [Tuwongella immobilis]|uniref:Bacterial type II secretion system protein E domain-containing protein n=1 Tax=Tuwongella immobilis TaxID=692036 RepID=A0A6C2YJJ1_9BACT|nr:CpaF family protein [Tuwongella immobilis]VIP01451.1 type ii secretion system protein e : Type II secretion system protein E OS=Pirellula staleyi (strain ATCC 27377 / DSM 6068 / ICPB 4128) GN=Psta_1434 PE=4 SV=1: T2SE [Tuwongella immobilis]VTR98445.1 type ii secretion system protein e : Type II secretion system protein E OS=Pirellula staleyi (strain ATCC 27377 / DSM 6068 / ICPB 4128) GN=Psta_1434 PE=4 SV=1: T2SE [Tuwongella immobilis]
MEPSQPNRRIHFLRDLSHPPEESATTSESPRVLPPHPVTEPPQPPLPPPRLSGLHPGLGGAHPLGGGFHASPHDDSGDLSHRLNLTSLPAEIHDFEELKTHLHSKLVDAIQPTELAKVPPERQRGMLARGIEQLIGSLQIPLSGAARSAMVQELLDDLLGLGPLERLLSDPSICDILVNGANQIYVERHGKLERSSVRFRDDDQLLEIIRRIVSRVGRRVDESSPMVDARLADGSRVNAIVPPLSLRGPMLSIRRFGSKRLNMPDLVALGALSAGMSEFLSQAVRAKMNIVVSGGTGSGKTTLLNALSAFIPHDERIITIEDAAELQLQQEHVGSLETRPPNLEGKGAVTVRDLVKNALRMRPNRIIIGECRGPETLDMLQAMNTGHEGSMTTLHANSPRDVLSRLEMMVMMGVELPLKVIRQQIASAVHLVVQVSRLTGGPRRITSITEVTGSENDVISMQELFRFRQLGLDADGRAMGQFEATGIRSHHAQKIEIVGGSLPAGIFTPGVMR